MAESAEDLQLTRVPSVEVGMLVRRPPREVFHALVDPAITTKFWFTRSSGRMEPGAELRWEWEMYGVSADVHVREVEEDSRVLFDWGDEDETTTVEFRFVPSGEDATYVEVAETGLTGDGDEVVSRVAASTGGFSLVLCA